MPRTIQPEPPIYTFRARILGGYYAPSKATAVWREIEIAANQTLADLGDALPLAFDFDDPHRWSFFLSGRAWDRASEYALQSAGGGPSSRSAGRVQIRDVPLPGVAGKKEFLFLFDYGDEWHFGVKLRRVSAQVEPGAQYPRLAASHGAAPPQYPNAEDDWDDEEEEEEDV
jgi:hypothetical protein